MVLDLDLFRGDKGGNPDRIRTNVKNRFADVSTVDKVVELDGRWRELRHLLDNLNKSRNKLSKEYGEKMKRMKASNQETEQEIESGTGGDGDNQEKPLDLQSLINQISEISKDVSLQSLKNYRKQIEDHLVETNEKLENAEKERNKYLREIGNLLHTTVPISDDEDKNEVICVNGNIELGKNEDKGKFKSHFDLLLMIGGADYDKGSNIAGSRHYFLRGPGVYLQQALIQFSLRFITKAGFEPLYTPFFMKKSHMSEVAQLSQFDEELYRIMTSEKEEEETYLIATSEQPIAALHRGEWMSPEKLPLKYAGFSTCFRKEAGSHGRDTRGIFRVHQFEKIEQFIISPPANSWNYFESMIKNAEDFYQALGIPYRVVSIVSGALNNAAAMKYDLEGWFPGSGEFRELVSVSNCTDYQSRRLLIRYGQTKKMTGQVEYVHMLNATLCAITRTICAILEVHQTPEGINVPEALKPYMPEKYETFIPFLQE